MESRVRNILLVTTIILVVLSVGFYGCSKGKSKDSESGQKSTLETVDIPEPQTSSAPPVSFENEQTLSQRASQGSSAMVENLPANWPADVPVVPGFKVTNSMVQTNGDLTLSLSGSNPLTSVIDFYGKNMEGWSKIGSGKPDIVSTHLAMVFEKQDKRVVITGDPYREGVILTINYGKAIQKPVSKGLGHR
jgi:hypothetical protein